MVERSVTIYTFGLKYGWFKHGKIYVRNTEDIQIIRFTSKEMVDELLLKNIPQTPI